LKIFKKREKKKIESFKKTKKKKKKSEKNLALFDELCQIKSLGGVFS